MRLTLCPLYSGSSGNCTYFACGGLRMLVDAGMSAARIKGALEEIGVELSDIEGILVTHEHIDHVRGLDVLARRYRIPVWANEGTWDAILERFPNIPADRRRYFTTDEDFYIGNVNIYPFSISHDTNDPVGFAFSCGSLKWSTATDIGHLDEHWLRAVEGSQALLLEANHDPMMVECGPYPMNLKRRILGRSGHLSNMACAEALLRLLPSGVQVVILAHLSNENNVPELAYDTVTSVLRQNGWKVDEDIRIMMARRERVSDLLVLETPD